MLFFLKVLFQIHNCSLVKLDELGLRVLDSTIMNTRVLWSQMILIFMSRSSLASKGVLRSKTARWLRLKENVHLKKQLN